MPLLIATTNQGKIKEILSLLSPLQIELLTPSDIGLPVNVNENGASYRENAELKAYAFYQASHLPTLADDTGLEVAALQGKPGIYSARFIPSPHATDRDRRTLLLNQLAPFPRPWKARFVCSATLLLPHRSPISKEAVCAGEIIPEERGEHGFGYDAIFLVAGTQSTMAELSLQEKNSLSHRAKAIRALFPYLQELKD